MKILHLDIQKTDTGKAKLWYFEGNPVDADSCSTLSTITIENLLEDCQQNYYENEYFITFGDPVKAMELGQTLYNWLNGEKSSLDSKINKQTNIILAISSTKELSHLPWELLHNGKQFLVERNIIPIRWVKESDDSTSKISIDEKNQPQNRALRLLFMATEPENSGLHVLGYETEEEKILEQKNIYHKSKLFLQIEDSGCLKILRQLVKLYGKKDAFDIFHLIGHAGHKEDKPYFVTETETGERHDANAKEIAEVFGFNFPRLIFLSGCYSGQAVNAGKAPSLAESLIGEGVKAVLGWGHKIDDQEGMIAASIFYQQLNDGSSLIEALGETYRQLLKDPHITSWHLLRLYVGDTLPNEFVTAPIGRPPAPALPESTELWGTDKTVAGRSSFVGRRRHIQHCLKALLPSSAFVGVVIYGFGGFGKSSLAARLCDRLSVQDYVPILWDLSKLEDSPTERGFIIKFNAILRIQYSKYPDLPKNLLNYEEIPLLHQRICNLFSDLNTISPSKNFLFIFDDFENVLELPNQESQFRRDKREVVEVLDALTKAIKDKQSNHRIIITSRYDLPRTFEHGMYLDRKELNEFEGTDLKKKLDRLEVFRSGSQVDLTLQNRARNIAKGNARLLEDLDRILKETGLNHEQMLQKLELLEDDQTPDYKELQRRVLTQELFEQVKDDLGQILSCGLIFEIPVPEEALKKVCEISGIKGITQNLSANIDKAKRLGLISVSPDGKLLYVVRTFLPISPPDNHENLAKQAGKTLYKLWWDTQWTEEGVKEFLRLAIHQERAGEIVRLALKSGLKEIALEVGDKLTKKLNEDLHFEKSIEICEEILAHWQTLNIYHNLAVAYYKRNGDIDKAKECYQRALEMPFLNIREMKKEQADLLRGYAAFLVDRYNGDLTETLDFLGRSLSIAQDINDPVRKAWAMVDLGRFTVYKNNKDRIGRIPSNEEQEENLRSAQNYLDKALDIFKNINDPLGEAWSLHNLGMVENSFGKIQKNSYKYRSGIQKIKESFSIHQANSKILSCASNLHQMGRSYLGLGELENARRCFKEAVEIKKKYGGVRPTSIYQWAKVEEEDGNILRGFELALEAMEVNQRLNRQDQVQNWDTIISLFKAWKERDFYDTEDCCEQSATDLMEKLRELSGRQQHQFQPFSDGQPIAFWGLGAIAIQQGERTEALGYLNQSLEIFGEINSKYAAEVQAFIEMLNGNLF